MKLLRIINNSNHKCDNITRLSMISLFASSIIITPFFYNKLKTISLTNKFMKTGFDKNKGIKLYEGILCSDNYVPWLTCNNNAIIRNIELTEIKYEETFNISPAIISRGGIDAINNTIEKIEGKSETFIAYSNPIKFKIYHGNNDDNYKILTPENLHNIMYENCSSGELSVGQIKKLQTFTNVNEFKADEILYKEWTIINNSHVFCIENSKNDLCSYDICNTMNTSKLRKYIGNKYYDEPNWCLITPLVIICVWIIIGITAKIK